MTRLCTASLPDAVFDVIITSREEEGEEGTIRLLKKGGFFLSILTPEVKAEIDVGTGFLSTKYTLILLNELTENMSMGEIDALIAHEAGHVMHNHFGGEDENGFVIADETQELQADAYAIEMYGKEVLTEALKKLIRNYVVMADDVGVYPGKTVQDIKDAFMVNPILNERFTVLLSN